MEYVLILFVIGFLFYFKNSNDSKFERLDEKIRMLDKLLKNHNLSEKIVEKVTEKVVEKPIITTPIIEVPKPIDPQMDEIPPFPALGQTSKVLERVSFNNDTNTPKPEYKKPIPEIEEKSWWENFKEKNPDLEKFIGENLINKIGILILVLGVSYFVKYSIDKGWISEPFRVGIGVLCGATVMGVAHKLRQKYAAFSSVFVAGAIAIFYFTIAIAFHDYHLINQTVAFIIMVLITAFSCVISLSYNRMELAILSLIGGFAVPFMVSTGSGNYVVLFSYILVLDIGILAISYFKKWNLVKILAYIFTLILFGGWLLTELGLLKPHYSGALLFAFALYFLFNLINIINNLRTKGVFSSSELSILISNTFLFYTAGMLILKGFHPEFRGLFTTLLGVFNFLNAYILYKKFGLDKIAVYLLIGLTLTFITLAIPIQFEGNQITLFWAAEAVLLLWLSQKSGIVSFRFGSVILTFLMYISLLMDWNDVYNQNEILPILINKICLTGIFVTACLFSIYHLLKGENNNFEQFGITFDPKVYRKLISIALVVTAYFVGIFETIYQSDRFVYGSSSSILFPILYHLLFSLILFILLCKDNILSKIQIATIIGTINIVLFCFLFSSFPFDEHKHYISTGAYQRIGLYLHYICLLIVLYFAYRIYILNKQNLIFDFFNTNNCIWVVCFLIVFISSKELILNVLVISNQPVTYLEVKSSSYESAKDIIYAKELIANDLIKNVKTQTFKTGFPILWGVLAFVFLIIGIKKPSKSLRIFALTLLGLTIAKLFLYDISNASETGKIIAFILLGVLILIISFVYQKLKVLVQDDNKTNQNYENQ